MIEPVTAENFVTMSNRAPTGLEPELVGVVSVLHTKFFFASHSW